MGIQALISIGTLFAFLDELAELNRIKTTRSPSVFRVVIEHAVLVVVCDSDVAGNAFEVIEVQVLARNRYTLI